MLLNGKLIIERSGIQMPFWTKWRSFLFYHLITDKLFGIQIMSCKGDAQFTW